jgi:hypothetical protein
VGHVNPGTITNIETSKFAVAAFLSLFVHDRKLLSNVRSTTNYNVGLRASPAVMFEMPDDREGDPDCGQHICCAARRGIPPSPGLGDRRPQTVARTSHSLLRQFRA